MVSGLIIKDMINDIQKPYSYEIRGFIEYCQEYYGIYPLGSDEQIENACIRYINSKPLFLINFDYTDRENVRMMLETEYQNN